MNMLEIYNLVNNAPEYAFLENNVHLGDNVILLTLGGSHAYGTNIEGSDVDIRGCALNTGVELLTGNDFEVVTEKITDTTIYSFKKLVPLLFNCNPNTIEMLGCKSEHYIKLAPAGKLLIDNADLFLSQKAVYSFSGYANEKLRRLENLTVEEQTQAVIEKQLLSTMQHMCANFAEKYNVPEGALKLYLDKAVSEDMDTEIFMDVDFKHYPVRDYCDFCSELKAVIKTYKTLGCRNSKAIEHKKLGKHMMHLVRLYLMGIDILEGRGVVTYREKEHSLLMDIRNGVYSNSETLMPLPVFFDMIHELEEKFGYAKNNTTLPVKPDVSKVNELVVEINKFAFKHLEL